MVIISRMSKHWVATGYSGRNDETLGLHKLPKWMAFTSQWYQTLFPKKLKLEWTVGLAMRLV